MFHETHRAKLKTVTTTLICHMVITQAAGLPTRYESLRLNSSNVKQCLATELPIFSQVE